MPPLDDKINAAFAVACPEYSSYVSPASRARIVEEYGDEVLPAVIEIVELATSYDDIWTRQSDLANSAAEVAKRIQAAHPYLSPQALQKAVNLAAFTWK
jgi:hypothetical protein